MGKQEIKEGSNRVPLCDAIDRAVLRLAAEYVRLHRAATAQNKNADKSAYTLGSEVHKAWKGSVESMLATDPQLKQLFEECQTSTGVGRHAGHPKLIDLRLLANV